MMSLKRVLSAIIGGSVEELEIRVVESVPGLLPRDAIMRSIRSRAGSHFAVLDGGDALIGSAESVDLSRISEYSDSVDTARASLIAMSECRPTSPDSPGKHDLVAG